MMHKPYNMTEWEDASEKAENGHDGYYPIGISDFWHSGIHLEKGGIPEGKAFLSGKVAAYRISESYRKVSLLSQVNEHEYANLKTEEKEKYRVVYSLGQGLQILQGEYLKNPPQTEISDNFILLRHEHRVTQLVSGKLIFYTLYVNLAPVNEVPEGEKESFRKLFKCDGQPHVLAEKEQFYLSDKIYIGKKRGRECADFAVLMEKSLFNEKEQAGLGENEKRYIFEASERSKVYQIEKEEKTQENGEYLILSQTAYTVQKEFSYKGTIYQKIRLDSIRIYFASEEVNKKVRQYEKRGSKIKIVSSETMNLTFDTITLIFHKKGDNNEIPVKCRYLEAKLKAGIFALSDKKEWDIEWTASTQPGVRFRLKEDLNCQIEFWTNRQLTNRGEGRAATQTITVFEEMPIKLTFKETGTAAEKEKIKGISEQKILDENETEYKAVEGITERYIKSDEEQQWKKSAFNWASFFIDKTQGTVGYSKGIICDRKELLKELDESGWVEKVLQNKVMNESVLGCIFGNRGDFEGAEELRKKLRKVVCRHPVEWNEENFKNIKDDSEQCGIYIRPRTERDLQEESKVTDIWKGGLEKVFGGKEPYFVHPYYFLNHLEKARIFEFNPYAGKTFIFVQETANVNTGKTGDHLESESITVKDNPGFAPLASTNAKTTPVECNGVKYAGCSSPFNINRVGSKWKNLRHTGIDLAPGGRTDIVSLIYGTVWAYTFDENYGNVLIVKDDNKDILYFLAHLESSTCVAMQKVNPEEKVAVTGDSGEWGKGAVHLHLEVYECKGESDLDARKAVLDETKNKIPGTGSNAELKWTWKDTFRLGNRRNPFNYTEKHKG